MLAKNTCTVSQYAPFHHKVIMHCSSVLRKRSETVWKLSAITVEKSVHDSADRIPSLMHHIPGCDRNQTLLLPNSVDDYIGPDNPVRFVELSSNNSICKELDFAELSPKRPADQVITLAIC